MSGQNVPYHLRTNKFVERQLFLDILDFVRVWNGSSRYVYASMGGRFLEDFKLLNDRFAIEHMICIELDETTWRRQEFNRLGFIECRNQSSGEFIEGFDKLVDLHRDKKVIVWLDYAAANMRGEQLGEYRQLVSKLASGDVVKITLNANSQSYRRRASSLTKKDFNLYLKDPESPTHKNFETYLASLVGPKDEEANSSGPERSLTLTESEYERICLENLKEQLGEYLPLGGVSTDHLKAEAFAALLAESVKVAALKGVEGAKLQAIPLGVFRYRDGEHQMLTVTALIADDLLAASIGKDNIFSQWPFCASHWSQVYEVNVPDISVKERHLIEGLISLQQDHNAIHAEIPFRLDGKEEQSLSLLAAYLQHYRRYPSFGRIQ